MSSNRIQQHFHVEKLNSLLIELEEEATQKIKQKFRDLRSLSGILHDANRQRDFEVRANTRYEEIKKMKGCIFGRVLEKCDESHKDYRAFQNARLLEKENATCDDEEVQRMMPCFILDDDTNDDLGVAPSTPPRPATLAESEPTRNVDLTYQAGSEAGSEAFEPAQNVEAIYPLGALPDAEEVLVDTVSQVQPVAIDEAAKEFAECKCAHLHIGQVGKVFLDVKRANYGRISASLQKRSEDWKNLSVVIHTFGDSTNGYVKEVVVGLGNKIKNCKIVSSSKNFVPILNTLPSLNSKTKTRTRSCQKASHFINAVIRLLTKRHWPKGDAEIENKFFESLLGAPYIVSCIIMLLNCARSTNHLSQHFILRCA